MSTRGKRFQILLLAFLICGCNAQALFDAEYPTPLQSRRAAAVSLAPIEFTEGLSDFVVPPVGPGDAADHYVSLFILYGLEPEDGIDAGGQGVAELLRGAGCARCSVGEKLARLRPVPDASIPVLEVLQSYANAAVTRAVYLMDGGRPAQAEEILRDVSNFGRHLSRSSDDLAFVMAGAGALRIASEAYTDFFTRAARPGDRVACALFVERLRENEDTLAQKYRAISDYIDFASLEACIKVVTADPAPMWRKEACIGLALMRFGALRAENSRTVVVRNAAMEAKAGEVLKEAAKNDSDEAVRKFAAWCIENVTAGDLASARLGLPAGAGGGAP